MYVVRTDLRCRNCGVTHEYATRDCMLIVYTDPVTAELVSRVLYGRVEPIMNVPDGVPYHLYVHKEGKPDPTYAT